MGAEDAERVHFRVQGRGVHFSFVTLASVFRSSEPGAASAEGRYPYEYKGYIMFIVLQVTMMPSAWRFTTWVRLWRHLQRRARLQPGCYSTTVRLLPLPARERGTRYAICSRQQSTSSKPCTPIYY